MQIELYLVSPQEEYVGSGSKGDWDHHWNYQWEGRSREASQNASTERYLVRKEEFGGLLMAPDAKVYKLDNDAYEFIKRLIDEGKYEGIKALLSKVL